MVTLPDTASWDLPAPPGTGLMLAVHELLSIIGQLSAVSSMAGGSVIVVHPVAARQPRAPIVEAMYRMLFPDFERVGSTGWWTPADPQEVS
jgi:hypothetical protein